MTISHPRGITTKFTLFYSSFYPRQYWLKRALPRRAPPDSLRSPRRWRIIAGMLTDNQLRAIARQPRPPAANNREYNKWRRARAILGMTLKLGGKFGPRNSPRYITRYMRAYRQRKREDAE